MPDPIFVPLLASLLAVVAPPDAAPPVPMQEACPATLAELTCAKVELRVSAPAGHVLAGEVLLPPGGGDVPVVLLISGTGRQSRDFAVFGGAYHPHRDLARALLAAGIGVVRFDERSTGASTGDHRSARSADLRHDAQLIFQAAAGVAGVDTRRMYVFGHSEGAIFAMQLADEEPLVAGIVTSGTPFKSGREMTWDQIQAQTPRPPGMSDADHAARVQERYRETVQLVLSRPSLADLFDYDGAATAAKVRRPTLVLEGLEDRQVRPPQGRQVADAMRRAGNRQVRYLALPGVNHLLTFNPPGVTDYDQLKDYAVDPRVIRALTEWVRSAPAHGSEAQRPRRVARE